MILLLFNVKGLLLVVFVLLLNLVICNLLYNLFKLMFVISFLLFFEKVLFNLLLLFLIFGIVGVKGLFGDV